MERYLFAEQSLPKGFKFPRAYLDFVSRKPIPDLEPWWFLCEFKENADYWFDELKRQYPNRCLIPFAKKADSDDIACFDGADQSSEPAVYYVHAFASPGWEDRGSVINFSDWLARAEAESRQYKNLQSEDE